MILAIRYPKLTTATSHSLGQLATAFVPRKLAQPRNRRISNKVHDEYDAGNAEQEVHNTPDDRSSGGVRVVMEHT